MLYFGLFVEKVEGRLLLDRFFFSFSISRLICFLPCFLFFVARSFLLISLPSVCRACRIQYYDMVSAIGRKTRGRGFESGRS